MLRLWTRRVSVIVAGVILVMISCVAEAQPARVGIAQSVEPRPDDPVAVAVDWQAVRRDVVQRQRASLSAVRAMPRPVLPAALAPDEGAQTQVPILTPTQEALGFAAPAEARLYPRGDFYTLVIEGDGLLIEVFGTRLAHARPPDALAARQLRGTGPEGYRSTPTRYGREISFHRYNAAYSLTLECEAPQTDPRCDEPAYGERVWRSLQLMPGTRDGEGE